MRERGKIIAYSGHVNAGVIKTASGDKFLFTRTAWIDPSEPKVDMEVQFREDGKNAQDVHPRSD